MLVDVFLDVVGVCEEECVPPPGILHVAICV